jgi:transposase
VYLPTYSPDLNPIEEFFSELKAYIRRNFVRYEEDQEQGFQNFLERCLESFPTFWGGH